MDTATVAVTIVSIVAAKGCALLCLWLRLRWRTQRELARQRCLDGAVASIAGGGRLEFDVQGADGHRLRMQVVRGPSASGLVPHE